MGQPKYEVDGNDEQGWGVFDPIGDLLIIYQDKADADAHAAEHNRRFGYPVEQE
jgi:hypothetical protein